MDDQSIEDLTLAITCIVSGLCIATLPITISILVLLIREKSLFGRTFFTLYRIGLATDIISIVTGLALGVVPSLGWFLDFYINSEAPKRLFFWCSWSTRIMQGFVNTMICLNRATATLVPQLHRNIWNQPFLLRFVICLEILISSLIGFENSQHDARWVVYPSGRAFLQKFDTTALKWQYLRGFVMLATAIATMIVLYSIILIRFRLKLTITPSHKVQARGVKQANALLAIAVVVISLEIVYCVYYYFTFLDSTSDHRDRRVFFTKYFTVTGVYSILPTYILLVFDGTVRRELRSCML